MRIALLAVLALAAGQMQPASAEGMSAALMWMRMCKTADTWERVTRCYAGQSGHLSIARSFSGGKVVRVGNEGFPSPGLYVFGEHGRRVKLAGSWPTYSWGDVTILDAKSVSVAGRSGVRLEVGSVVPSGIVIDPQTVRPAVMRRRLALFCFGTRASCVTVVERCDVLVDGKSYYAFHGSLTIRGATAQVAGDRSKAGTCEPASEVPLLDGEEER